MKTDPYLIIGLPYGLLFKHMLAKKVLFTMKVASTRVKLIQKL